MMKGTMIYENTITRPAKPMAAINPFGKKKLARPAGKKVMSAV